MVVFTCNSCGDSVKKNQVEKHVFKCRQCMVLSCMDCGKEFCGEEYRMHNQCITEEEKYSGKNYEPKPNAEKGKKKQEEWVTILRENLNLSDAKPSVRNLIERILTSENIPRRQKKFENFVKSCMMVKDARLVFEAWSLISKAWETAKKPDIAGISAASENGKVSNTNNGEPPVEEIQSKALSKKERKAKRKLKSDLQTKDPQTELEDNNSEIQKQQENGDLGCKAKKRKRDEKISPDNNDLDAKKKKKHKNLTENGDSNACADLVISPAEIEHINVKKPDKFKWTNIITTLLEAANENELSLKKLKKKVVGEYLSRGYSKPTTKEQLQAKLLKKIQKNPTLRLHKERVKLIR